MPPSFKRLFIKTFYLLLEIYWFIFRPKTTGVKCILESKDEILFVRNSYCEGKWTLPGGGVKADETPKEAAKREIFEELGVVVEELLSLGSFYTNVEYKQDTVYCFKAKISKQNLIIDGVEIDETKWFSLENLSHDTTRSTLQTIKLYRHNLEKNELT